MKLIVRERESAALARVIPSSARLVTSELALVELTRAVRLAGLEDDLEYELAELLDGCTLVAVDSETIRSAASLASESLRPFEAIHLATALTVGADTMYVYDRQLGRAAREAGLRVAAPGSA